MGMEFMAHFIHDHGTYVFRCYPFGKNGQTLARKSTYLLIVDAFIFIWTWLYHWTCRAPLVAVCLHAYGVQGAYHPRPWSVNFDFRLFGIKRAISFTEIDLAVAANSYRAPQVAFCLHGYGVHGEFHS
jgi:hypothetical protein